MRRCGRRNGGRAAGAGTDLADEAGNRNTGARPDRDGASMTRPPFHNARQWAAAIKTAHKPAISGWFVFDPTKHSAADCELLALLAGVLQRDWTGGWHERPAALAGIAARLMPD